MPRMPLATQDDWILYLLAARPNPAGCNQFWQGHGFLLTALVVRRNCA